MQQETTRNMLKGIEILSGFRGFSFVYPNHIYFDDDVDFIASFTDYDQVAEEHAGERIKRLKELGWEPDYENGGEEEEYLLNWFYKETVTELLPAQTPEQVGRDSDKIPFDGRAQYRLSRCLGGKVMG